MRYLRLKALNTDLETGQELFRPKITKYSFKNTERPSRCENKLKRAVHKRANSCKLTSYNSERILERIKSLRFRKIFAKLAPENGEISAATISKASIPRRLRQVLRPLIEGLEIKQVSLGLTQFSVEMEELMKMITPEARNYIIKGEINELQQTGSTSPTRVRSGSEIGHGNERGSIYERGLEEVARIQGRIERLRENIEVRKMESCSFSPVIKKYSPPKPYIKLWKIESNHRLNQSSFN